MNPVRIVLIFLVIHTTLVGLFGHYMYKRGVEDVQFDRAVADIKLQNCSEVITKFKLKQ